MLCFGRTVEVEDDVDVVGSGLLDRPVEEIVGVAAPGAVLVEEGEVGEGEADEVKAESFDVDEVLGGDEVLLPRVD